LRSVSVGWYFGCPRGMDFYKREVIAAILQVKHFACLLL
jgi:hypothetical protein